MKNFHKLPVYLFSILAIAFSSCDSEDPEPENDQELITDVTVTFQELDASGNAVGAAFTAKASDPEGIETGGSPTIETVNLLKGKSYRMNITAFNSIGNEDITEEILEDSDEHQFYFLGTAFTSSILAIAYDDPSGELIGLRTVLTASASPGTNNTQMQILLRHDLDKNYPGASNPNFANYVQAGGATDLDITFPVVFK